MTQRRWLAVATAVLIPAGALLSGVGDSAISRMSYAVAKGRSDAALDSLARNGDIEHAFEVVANALTPSVVRISTTQVRRPSPDGFGLFRRPIPAKGVGSGVIIGDKGFIVTNHHVVAGAQKVEVRLSDGRIIPAAVVGSDPRTDIAVVRVKAQGLQAARMGDSDQAKVGQWVLAFGSPFGLDMSVTSGIISAKGRAGLGIAAYEDLIQTDAAINRGNSGGPLVNLRGEVIGINVAMLSRSGGSQGIGFSIPINQARAIMKRLIEKGRVTRGWLGVSMESLNQSLARSLGFDGSQGILIDEVAARSPAAAGGLQAHDVLLAMNGRPLSNSAVFQTLVASLPPGSKVRFRVWRAGQVLERDVTLQERDER